MNLRLALGRCLLWALVACSASATAQSPGAVGYVGWWFPHGWKSIQQASFDRLFFFELPIGENGELTELHGWPDRWTELITHTQTHSIPLDVTVSLMDLRRFDRVFGNPKSVERLERQLIALATDTPLSGFQFDIEIYEDASPPAVTAFRQFVQRIARQLRSMQPSRQVGVFLPFQTRSLLYDAETLGSAEYVVVQGYDSHWLESKTAGPVAPLDGPYALTWRKAVALADSLAVPSAKQYVSYPLYGYEWRVREGKSSHAATLEKGITTTFADTQASPSNPPWAPPSTVNVAERVLRFGAHFDLTSASSYYRYKASDGVWREGWFDDWWSVNAKSSFARERNLAGLAFFLLGYDDGALIQHYQRVRVQSEDKANPSK